LKRVQDSYRETCPNCNEMSEYQACSLTMNCHNLQLAC